MCRKYQVSNIFLQPLLDATAVTMAWTIAFELRNYVFAGQGLPEIEGFFLKLTHVVVTTSLIFYNVNYLKPDITRKEIARLLDISYQTVEKYRSLW